MMNKRVLKIIDVLLKQDAFITIDNVSAILQVSNKTIRNDLQIVDEWLQENNLSLIKKTGVGIKIDGKRNDKLRVMDSIKEKSNTLVEYSPQARKIFIGMQLLAFDNCRIYELSNQLYVSRATIHKDILALHEDLKTYKIRLNRKNNNGISLEGKERSFRNLLLDLMLHDNGYQMYIDIVRDTNYICDGSFVFPGLEVSDDEVKDFVTCILSANNKYIRSLPFQSLILVILRMFITFLRLQERHYVRLSENFMQELEKEPFYEDIKNLSDRITNHYRINFPDMEIRYMQVYFLALQNSSNLSQKDKEEALYFTNQIINSWQEQLQLPFDKDEDLKKALYAHICPAIMRFRHGIPNENPLLSDIHNLYELTFAVAKNSMICIEEYFSCKVSNDEIGYFALHLASSLEKMKQPLNTILVAHGGPGAANLLNYKLIQIPEISIIRTETYFSIHVADINKADIIISTTPLQLHTDVPVLQINSILHDYDILRIRDVIKDYYKQKNDPLNFKTALHK